MTAYDVLIHKMPGTRPGNPCRYHWTVNKHGVDVEYRDDSRYAGIPSVVLSPGVVMTGFAGTRWGARREARKVIRRHHGRATEVETFTEEEIQ